MSGDELRDAIAEVAWAYRPRPGGAVYQHGGISTADAILAMPEMQALLAKDAEIERLRAEVGRLRAAGDALAAIVGDVVVPYDDESKARTMVAAYDAWREARRER